LWTNRFNGAGNGKDQAIGVAVDATGNVFVTGFSMSVASSFDYVTIAYSPAGVALWTNRYGFLFGTDQAQAIALDSNYAPAHAYYSEILNDAQKWQQGTNEAELALSLDPTALDAHRAMGYAAESIGDYEGAIENYKKALAINPNLITLYISIGKNYRATGDAEKAIFYFSKANAIDPENLEPYLAISRTYYQIDEFGTAAQYLESALERDPANPDIHGRLGLIYFHAKNYEGAEPELLLVVFGGTTEEGLQVSRLELNESSREYYYTLGNLWAANYKCCPDEAPALLNQVIAKYPDNPAVLASYEESMTICRSFLTPTAEVPITPTTAP